MLSLFSRIRYNFCMEKEKEIVENTENTSTPIASDEEILAHRVKREKVIKRRLKASIKRDLWDFAKTFLVSALLVFVVVHYIATPVQVIGSSMYPTLKPDERGFSNVLGRRMSGLKRFDIAVIYMDGRDEYLVKRVIGLPGETIRYQDDRLYINGEYVEEPFLDASYKTTFSSPFTSDIEELVLGDNEVFCMGDNRPSSRDSRFYGPFSLDQITSKGVFVIFPFAEFGVKSW